MSNLNVVVRINTVAQESSENFQCNDRRPATLLKNLRSYKH